MDKQVIVLDGKVFSYTLERSKRRHIGLYIRPEGLLVKAPHWVQKSFIDEALVQKTRWILKKTTDLKKQQEILQAHQTCWEDGGQLLYLGDYYTLRCQPSSLNSNHAINRLAEISHETKEIFLNISQDATAIRIKSLCKLWLYEQALDHLGSRLTKLSQYAVCAPKNWRLSYAKTRWGSCTRDKRLMLNWRLIHFDPSIIDYVIAHELAHLKEMNHGPLFWMEVERILPTYDSAKERLKKFDTALLPDFSRSSGF